MNPATSTAQWYKVSIPAAKWNTQGKTIQNDFETLFAINHTPNGAALFSSRGEQEHAFYFSAGAVAIARGLIEHFSGEACRLRSAKGTIQCCLWVTVANETFC